MKNIQKLISDAENATLQHIKNNSKDKNIDTEKSITFYNNLKTLQEKMPQVDDINKFIRHYCNERNAVVNSLKKYDVINNDTDNGDFSLHNHINIHYFYRTIEDYKELFCDK